jgi:ketosteroid isomerase-like protein
VTVGTTTNLESLLAERDITRLVYDYADAVDRRDFDGIARCYWDDGWDDHAPEYDGPVAGYVAWLREVMPPGPVLTHQFGNVRIDVAPEGDSASVDSYCTSTATFPGPAGPESPPAGWMQLGLRYLDTVTRRDGTWKFARRHCRRAWIIDNGVAQVVPPTD